MLLDRFCEKSPKIYVESNSLYNIFFSSYYFLYIFLVLLLLL